MADGWHHEEKRSCLPVQESGYDSHSRGLFIFQGKTI